MDLQVTALASLRRLAKCLWWMTRSWESVMYVVYHNLLCDVIPSSAVLISISHLPMPSS